MGRGVSIRGSVQRAVIALAFGAGLLAHAQSAATAQASLMVLASAKFPNLTRAERALLEFADVGTIARENEWAVGGTSAKLDDPSNDPRHAAEWGPERNIRASLIRWLCVDPDAVKMIDPLGIRILGARIVGPLNLFNTRVPFGLTLRRSVVVEPIDLRLAELATLDLGGSYTSSIDAESIHIHGDVDMRDGFHAAAEVLFDGAQIGGSLDCAGGTFVHSSHAGNDFWAEQRPALSLNGSRIDGAVLLCCGFHSDGAVLITGSTLSNLICSGGYFVNPGKFALSLDGSNVSGYAALGTKWANRPAPTAGPNSFGEQRQGLQADGVVFFANSKVGAFFRADGARFLGKSSEPHGLVAIGMSAGGIVWLDVDLQNGAELETSRMRRVRGCSTMKGVGQSRENCL